MPTLPRSRARVLFRATGAVPGSRWFARSVRIAMGPERAGARAGPGTPGAPPSRPHRRGAPRFGPGARSHEVRWVGRCRATPPDSGSSCVSPLRMGRAVSPGCPQDGDLGPDRSDNRQVLPARGGEFVVLPQRTRADGAVERAYEPRRAKPRHRGIQRRGSHLEFVAVFPRAPVEQFVTVRRSAGELLQDPERQETTSNFSAQMREEREIRVRHDGTIALYDIAMSAPSTDFPMRWHSGALRGQKGEVSSPTLRQRSPRGGRIRNPVSGRGGAGRSAARKGGVINSGEVVESQGMKLPFDRPARADSFYLAQPRLRRGRSDDRGRVGVTDRSLGPGRYRFAHLGPAGSLGCDPGDRGRHPRWKLSE